MKKLTLLFSMSLFVTLLGCGDDKKASTESQTYQLPTQGKTEEAPPAYDPKRGEGKHTAESLALTETLNSEMAKEGENISGVKCFSCHKATDEKLVGPGWKDVTKRRTPEWLMNFITNPDPMIDKDPEVQAMLEICLVRMPNQNLTDDEARKILEFMRKNDGLK